MSMSSGADSAAANTFTVLVPASSANLGCAFDCAALALDRYCKVQAIENRSSRLHLRYRGANSDRVPNDDTNLVIQSIRRMAAELGVTPPGATVEIENQIPVSAGLGASAASTVAGLMVGALLCGRQPEADLVLRLAAAIEGHPDNAAAACKGGLVFAMQSDSTSDLLTIRTSFPPELKIVAIVPELALPTKKAREVLPERYAREDAVHNLQRACFLAASFFSRQDTLFPELFRDRMHQPYRSTLVPGLERCLQFQHRGLLGVFLSGSGPSVLAIARHSEPEIAASLGEYFHQHDIRTETLFLRADNQGARIETAGPDDSPEQDQSLR
jgi:homoserine kinase